jgi:hypothetical protein
VRRQILHHLEAWSWTIGIQYGAEQEGMTVASLYYLPSS